MTCLDDLDVLSYIEQRMAEAQLREVREHLDGCVDCLSLVAQLSGRPPTDGLTLGRTISSGGMGVVVEAFDQKLERRIAVKLPRTDDALAQQRFAREVKITARLQHPAIVPVYAAGTLGDGEPYYAMRLVDGETLDVAIARAPTLTARLALLRAVTTVTGAIAYAHAQGVLHRDIKPANVLVGQFGEVVVIDWGLARATDDPDDALATGSSTSIVGTPAYMPPEQARGEPIDARADVYALGALLHHVLAGKPGGDLPPELPRDLVAIAARAMAPDPVHRYHSVAALADDLERFQAGQLVGAHAYSLGQLLRRWVAKHRTAIAIGALALVALVVTGGIAISRVIRAEQVADTQRQHAVANRADAEELMEFMLVDMRDKLRPIGKLEILDTVAQKARSYYERRDSHEPVDLEHRAAALQNVGDVLIYRGDLAGALVVNETALALQLGLVAIEASDAHLRSVSIGLERVGEIHVKQGDEDTGLRRYRASLAIEERRAARDPDNSTLQRNVAITRAWIGGALLGQGKRDEALAEFRTAMQIDERVAATDPTNATWQQGLSVRQSRVGDVLLEQGNLSGALGMYRASLVITEKLSATAPENTDVAADLVRSRLEVAEVLRAQAQIDPALALYRSAQSLAESLVARDPTNAAWNRIAETASERVGEVLYERRDFAGALVAFRTSFTIAQRLAAKDPTNPTWQRDLSVAYDKLGSTLVALGKFDEGIPALRASLASAERIAAGDPDDANLQRDVVVSHTSVGDAAAAAHDLPTAIAEYRAALALAQSLLGKHDAAASDLAEVQATLAKLVAKQSHRESPRVRPQPWR